MKTAYILLFICLFASCNEKVKNSTNEVLDNELAKVIDSYIESNPLDLPIKNQLYKNGFSYPSYHIFFREKNKDTIMSIIQFSHLNDFEIESHTIENDEESYNSIEPDGFLIYKEKYPIVIFNSYLYSNGYDLKKHLTTTIPDSLKFNKENYHIDFIKWDYEIQKTNFERMN